MPDSTNMTDPDNREEFLNEAEAEREGLISEFWYFLKHNKKWWLIPILVTILLIGLIAVLASNPATAPFIYPLF